MIDLSYSKPMDPVWSITNAVPAKQLASSGRTVTAIKLVSAGGSAHVSIYDNANGNANANDLVWVMDSSLQTNDDDKFVDGLAFYKGIYAVCDDGAGFNPILCLAFKPDQV